MNINRLKPTGVKKEDLDLWLSGVIYDAIKDARDAGLPAEEAARLVRAIAKSECRVATVPMRPRTEPEQSKEYVRQLIESARSQVREAIFEAARFREPIDDLVELEKGLLTARRERSK